MVDSSRIKVSESQECLGYWLTLYRESQEVFGERKQSFEDPVENVPVLCWCLSRFKYFVYFSTQRMYLIYSEELPELACIGNGELTSETRL